MSYIDMNQPWIYMYSPSRSPLPPPSPPDPSGSSQCTRSEHLSHASNLGYYLTFLRVIIIKECWILPKVFSASIEIITQFLFFVLWMWCIMLTDLLIWPLLASLEWDALHHGVVLLFLSLSCIQQFCDPVVYSPACSSVHRISQARILEHVAISCSKSWTTKKTEHWRIDAFESWFWRRLLRVPWTARRSSQSILKDINPEY